ncbi:hypothetical protein [Agreia sp. Leaf210]|uniref:hypothetical protein n=1 Tax=Agreia sp. Leaf210 TaxID=1735682 RepID=UPI0006F764CD|nr:hypothetical protein [Agreia sp. Leaf210]KQM58388.1 hypothetical protein ASE64_12855 [Agreia sp. Leaf210]
MQHTASREGSRPPVSTEGPQRQLSERSTPELWGRLLAEVFALPGVVEGHSAVSPPSSRAVHLEDRSVELRPETSLAPGHRLESVHLHGVSDTSIHACLPARRGAELRVSGSPVVTEPDSRSPGP